MIAKWRSWTATGAAFSVEEDLRTAAIAAAAAAVGRNGAAASAGVDRDAARRPRGSGNGAARGFATLLRLSSIVTGGQNRMNL